jgi:hypothetical protein
MKRSAIPPRVILGDDSRSFSGQTTGNAGGARRAPQALALLLCAHLVVPGPAVTGVGVAADPGPPMIDEESAQQMKALVAKGVLGTIVGENAKNYVAVATCTC